MRGSSLLSERVLKNIPLKVIIKIDEHQIYCVCHHPPLHLIGVRCFLDKHISTLKRTEKMDSQ